MTREDSGIILTYYYIFYGDNALAQVPKVPKVRTVLQGFVKYVADTTESYFDQFEQVGFQLCFF